MTDTSLAKKPEMVSIQIPMELSLELKSLAKLVKESHDWIALYALEEFVQRVKREAELFCALKEY